MLHAGLRELHQTQVGLEINVVELGQSWIVIWKGNGFDRVVLGLARQESQTDGRLHFKAEISKASEGERLSLRIESFDLHG